MEVILIIGLQGGDAVDVDVLSRFKTIWFLAQRLPRCFKISPVAFNSIIASRFLLNEMNDITSMSTTAEQKKSCCRNWDR